LAAKAGENQNNWLLLKEKDDYTKSSDGISELTTSARTGRTMKEIAEGKDEN
jgi:bifunctional non-homologous end joining protein LigD